MQAIKRNPYIGRGINDKINYILELLDIKGVSMTVFEVNQYLSLGVRCYLIMDSANMQGLVDVVGYKTTPALACQTRVKRKVYSLTIEGQQRLKYKR